MVALSATNNNRDNMKMLRNKKINQVFNELEDYRDFCRDYGYTFDEKDLYRRNSPYAQYERARRGDPVINHWVEDAKLFGRNIG